MWQESFQILDVTIKPGPALGPSYSITCRCNCPRTRGCSGVSAAVNVLECLLSSVPVAGEERKTNLRIWRFLDVFCRLFQSSLYLPTLLCYFKGKICRGKMYQWWYLETRKVGAIAGFQLQRISLQNTFHSRNSDSVCARDGSAATAGAQPKGHLLCLKQ